MDEKKQLKELPVNFNNIEQKYANQTLIQVTENDVGIGFGLINFDENGRLDDVVATIEDPDWIREGRDVKTEELYVRVESQSKLEFTGTLAATRMIDGKMVIMTTAYDGNDSDHKGKMKWSKIKGDLS